MNGRLDRPGYQGRAHLTENAWVWGDRTQKSGRPSNGHGKEPFGVRRACEVLVGNADAVDMGEIFADCSGVRHEGVTVGMLHAKVGG